jgi:hypothetical protein
MAGARKLFREGQAKLARFVAKPLATGAFEASLWETLWPRATPRRAGFPYAARLR